MNILIRCDSSNIIGTGHVMRCLNYTEYFPDYDFTFVCRDFNMNISSKIVEKNHTLILLKHNIEPEINNYRSWIGCNYTDEIDDIIKILEETQYDKIIFDHYGIDYLLEKEIKNRFNNTELIVISDIFDYNHYCDIFINYNTDNILAVKSINLNENTEYHIGVENIIINKKFKESRKKEKINSKIKSIVINMGGADPANYILKVLYKINNYVSTNDITVNIVVGKSNNNIESINQFIKTKNYNYIIHYDVNYDNLIDLYLNTDLAIGSLSITAYERLFLNIPQICLKIVDNQLIQQLKEFNITNIDNLMDKINELTSL